MNKNGLIIKATVAALFNKKKLKEDRIKKLDTCNEREKFEVILLIVSKISDILPIDVKLKIDSNDDKIIISCKNMDTESFLAYLDKLYEISDKYQREFKCYWILNHENESNEHIKIHN